MKLQSQINEKQLLELHLMVLKEIIAGKTFEQIKDTFAPEFNELNYLEIAKNNLLSFHNGELVGAYPISPMATKYQIHVEDIGDGYAMCAIDALGVAYTFMKRVKILTTLHDSGESIHIEIDPFIKEQQKQDFLITYKKFNDREGNAALGQCPTINIFGSSENVPKNQDLEVISFDTALKYAKERFSQESLIKCILGSFDQQVVWEKTTTENLSCSDCNC